jgi:hypothetical protein
MRRALDELQGVISHRYPTAQFEILRDVEEPENIDLLTTVDLEDPDEVLDLVMDRLIELQVDEGVPVHVVPIRNPERILAAMQSESRPRRLHRRISSVSGQPSPT